MSDERPTSWRERFFGSAPAESAPTGDDAAAQEPVTTEDAALEQHSAELAPDSVEVAATAVDDHDDHQPLVEHERETAAADAPAGTEPGSAVDADADTAVLDAQQPVDDPADSPIEPTVIAPSSLRGPSHSAAHPDDSARAAHGDAAESSLEQPPAGAAEEPPELVEPRRPSFGLRRRADGSEAETTADDAPANEADDDASGIGVAAAAAGAGAAGATAAGAASRDSDPAFEEPAPTQAIDAQAGDDQATRAIDTQHDTTQTQVLDAQDERTERFGIIRDEVPASSIPVDDETARATAAGGTPIVLVEEPMPPRRKGARGVGFAVALLATLIFAIVWAAAFFAVGYLFDRGFDAQQTLETLWLRPSYLLPVIVFFIAYWLVTLIVNRAGWWAHVLGAFLVALLVYAAHIGGAFMEERGGWEAYTAVPGIDPQALGQLLLAPLSVLAFVIAREVPVWVGGIVARRGRKAREYNRQALDDFNAENAERLAEYERARG